MNINWLYTNWAKICLILSIVVTILIFLVVKTNNLILFLIWHLSADTAYTVGKRFTAKVGTGAISWSEIHTPQIYW